MLILSIGMPRAGSGWYYNLTHDLIVAAGHQDARRIRKQYHLQKILTEVNCNIGTFTPHRLLAVMIPSLVGNTFVIKAHAEPTYLTLQLIRHHLLLPTYIYRDPRDAMLSAWEYGQRAIEKGRSNAFSHLVDFNTALDFIIKYIKIWEVWMACSEALHVRYEDFLENYDEEVKRLVEFLRIDTHHQKIQSVVEKYRPVKASQTTHRGLHFSKGKIGRYLEKLSEEQVVTLETCLGPYLVKMGY